MSVSLTVVGASMLKLTRIDRRPNVGLLSCVFDSDDDEEDLLGLMKSLLDVGSTVRSTICSGNSSEASKNWSSSSSSSSSFISDILLGLLLLLLWLLVLIFALWLNVVDLKFCEVDNRSGED